MKSGQLFSLPVRRRAFRLAILVSAAILGVTSGPFAQNARRTGHQQIILEQNGFFYGREQYYLVTPPLIHVYYQPSDEYDNASEEIPKRSTGVELPTQLNPGAYFHEIFVLANGKWAKKYRAVSTKPDSYLTGNSCDTTNALDLPGGLLRDALPRPIKIKEIEDRTDYAIVVYSDTPNQNEYYSLKTALLGRDSLSWHVETTIFSGSAMRFCGTKTFRAAFSRGEDPLVFLLYLGDLMTDEADFISIQSFLLRENKADPQPRRK